MTTPGESLQKQLWLLVGGNGSGKSTFYHTRLEPLGIPFINADIIARELYPDAAEDKSYDAAKVAQELRETLLQEGRNFCFETEFSHPSKIDFVAKAKALGYQVILVYVHLDSSMLSRARVAQRVLAGGHSVPDDKVEQRLPRLKANVKTAIPLCDRVYLLDNSRLDSPFEVIAEIAQGQSLPHTSLLPDWAAFLIDG
ncbi:MAG: AAA family ATPase [Halioglobus sp.]